MDRKIRRSRVEIDDTKSELPQIQRYTLVHFKQRFDWDCGISCVMMVLSRRQRQEFLRYFGQICTEQGFGTSTWTIDLCYLLRRFGIRHIYTTVTIGVDPNFRDHHYYGPIFWQDHIRVSSKFQSAASNGLNIQKKTVDIRSILEHLAKNGPVIVLTNEYLLHCNQCKVNGSERLDELRKCFTINKPKIRYSGHFIVVCGYDHRIESVFYRNPALDDRICVMSYHHFNKARTANGTDEDLIFIYFNENE